VLAVETSAPGSSGIVVESLVAVPRTEGVTLALASTASYLWWFEELVRLQEARPNIASQGLSME
jgi:hypothetical protein